MKLAVLALATLAIATTLAATATAQRVSVPNITTIRTDSQDFFKQGREQFEREIRFVMLRSYFPDKDLLKIRSFEPLEDGPFSVEQSDALIQVRREDFSPHARLVEDSSPRY
jgi:hypothetical protein